MNRRLFLQSAIGLGLVSYSSMNNFLTASAATGRIKNVGLALYTVRELMADNVERTLSLIAATGYKEVEFSGYFGHSPQQIKKILKRTGLVSPAMHPGAKDVRGEALKRTIENTLEIGHKYIALAAIIPEERKTIDDYKRHAELFNIAGEQCKAAGLQFAYHNHAFEFDQEEDKDGFDVLLDETEPDLVEIEIDLYWITKANRDPLKYFDRYPGRFPICHIKDMDKDGSFEDPGKGVIDFERIFAHSKKAGIKHFMVEQDEPKDIVRTLRDSIKAVKNFTIS